MKLLLNIYKYTFKQLAGNPLVLISVVLLIGISLGTGALSLDSDRDDIYMIGVVDSDEGEFSAKFLDELQDIESVRLSHIDRDKAKRMISFGLLDGAVLINKDFSEGIESGNYSGTLELLMPESTTAVYPLSESMAMIVLEMWLDKVVDDTLIVKYNETDEVPYDSYEEFRRGIEEKASGDDIIELIYIGDESRNNANTEDPLMPFKNATDIYGKFILFIAILSTHWVFSLKHKALTERLKALNLSFTGQYISSISAAVTVFMLGYLLLGGLYAILVSPVHLTEFLRLTAGMLLYLSAVSAISVLIATLSKDMVQLVLAGTTVTVLNLLLTGIQGKADTAIASMLPGSRIFDFVDNTGKWYLPVLMSAVWIAASLVIIFLKRLGEMYNKRNR